METAQHEVTISPETFEAFKATVPMNAVAAGVMSPYRIDTPVWQVDSPAASTFAAYESVVPAGEETGWHYHAGVAFVTITAGSVTLFEQSESGRISTIYRAGQTFVEKPGQVVNVVNTGDGTAKALTTVIGTPLDQPTHTNVPTPAGY